MPAMNEREGELKSKLTAYARTRETFGQKQATAQDTQEAYERMEAARVSLGDMLVDMWSRGEITIQFR